MTLIVFCLFSGKNTQDIGLPQQNSPILDFRTIQELVDEKYTKKQITFLDGQGDILQFIRNFHVYLYCW